MELLGTQQKLFTRKLLKLLQFAFDNGYEITLGDAYRDPRVFGVMGESKGYGQAKSAHKQRLAIDLNLFKDGVFLSNTEDHKPLGEFWESIGGVWGGRFTSNPDGNHYSIEYGGIK